MSLILLRVVFSTPGASAQIPVAPSSKLAAGEWNFRAITQEKVGHLWKLRGAAGVASEHTLFRADEIEWNEATGELHATGHVYYHNFAHNEQLWCGRLDYNTDDETGKFYQVRGEMHPRHAVVRPGVLPTASPFHFEGEWAERIGEKYILYRGWVTDCKTPRPWWRMRGAKFDIIPERRALAYRSWFVMQKMPLLYAPFFYHSLEREPRRSGLLIPEPEYRSDRGFILGLGFFWAVSRGYDLTYLFQDMTAGGYRHHAALRGAVSPGTDFVASATVVQDRATGNPDDDFSGATLTLKANSALGKGWTALGNFNYISSLRYRRHWAQSFTEAIDSEVQSTGVIDKSWGFYTFDGAFARLQHFESEEVPLTDPNTGDSRLVSNAVTIRKLPEVEFTGRDRQLFAGVPLWFSFESSAGLLSRSEPLFDSTSNPTALVDTFQTGQFVRRVNFAPRLTTAFHWAGIHLVPSFGIRETYSSQTQTPGGGQAVSANARRGARDFSLDVVLPSLARVFDRKTIFGDKLKHVIEPRASYRYVTGVGGDFNRYIRFDEGDLLTDTNELELSLTNRIYARRGDAVQEILTWEVLLKRYFDPTFGGALVAGQRNVFESTAGISAYTFLLEPRGTSPVISRLRAGPGGGLGVEWQSDYDARVQRTLANSVSVDYRRELYSIGFGNQTLNLDPRLAAPANQLRGKFLFGQVNRRGWNAGIDQTYDYRQGYLANVTAQGSYNTDCCGFSVQYRRWNTDGHTPDLGWSWAFTVANIGTWGPLKQGHWF